MPDSFSLSAAYRRVARARPLDELTDAYRSTIARGSQHAGEEPATHPIGPLSSTIPRLVRLAATAHILHVVPSRARERTPGGLEIVEQLFATLEETGAGALYLCNVALECADRTDPVDEWVSYAVEEAADALPHVSFTALPPSLISHAEEATRCVAVAIDQAHADPPAAPRAIADALSHLLVVCVFADVLADRPAV